MGPSNGTVSRRSKFRSSTVCSKFGPSERCRLEGIAHPRPMTPHGIHVGISSLDDRSVVVRSLPPCVLVWRTANVDHGFTNVPEHVNCLFRRLRFKNLREDFGEGEQRYSGQSNRPWSSMGRRRVGSKLRPGEAVLQLFKLLAKRQDALSPRVHSPFAAIRGSCRISLIEASSMAG